VNDKSAGDSAQAEYERRAARRAEDLRRRRPRILAFGAMVAIIGLVVVVIVNPLYGAVVLLFDLVLVMTALFATPNSITHPQRNRWENPGSAKVPWVLASLPQDRHVVAALVC
jgi:hypothetical protein